MNEQQTYALAHPLNRADGDPAVLAALGASAVLPGGNLLHVVLAVDR